MYYTENNHNKVVLRDFYLSRFENGPITEPCGTPEYLGKMQRVTRDGRTHSQQNWFVTKVCSLKVRERRQVGQPGRRRGQWARAGSGWSAGA